MSTSSNAAPTGGAEKRSGPEGGIEFDPARLDAFLRGALPGLAGAMRLERIAGGQSNPTFFVSYDDRRLVLRKQPPGELAPSAHAVDREYRVMKALTGTPVPVPPLVLFHAERDVVGTPFYLMERVEGRVFHDGSLPGLSPAERRGLYLAMAETMAALHQVDWQAVGLGDYGRPGNYFQRQIARWTRQYEISKTEAIPDIERLVAWLPANLPSDEEAAICHGDFRIGNLMFHPTEARVVAVLDWELSTIGHPLADVAFNVITWHSRPEEYGGIRGLDIAALGIPPVEDYLAHYYACAGRTSGITVFHLAFSLFRFAVIFEGIAARARSGNAAAENAAKVGRLSRAFARRAVELIEGRGEGMDFDYTPKVQALRQRVRDFMERHVVPRDPAWLAETEAGRFPMALLDELKAKARAEGLWNLFLPGLKPEEPGTRLSNLEYAPLAEIMGRVPWASEVFNCNAPDTGNMELLHLFATPAQRERWLDPMLSGEIRSCFAMTEPEVASADPTNLRTTIRRDGDSWVVEGHKWFTTNALHPNCRFAIVMGVSDERPDADPHRRHSMVIVPMGTPGFEVVRNVAIMHHYAPEGHCETRFSGVRVPLENLLGEEGQGFRLAQARLGPGRVHHCMRSIGQCELALELLCERALERQAFGRHLADYANIQDWIALSRIEIDQARLLVLRTAWLMDREGNAAARTEVSAIKLAAARLQTQVLDRAMQVFGAMGLTPDTPLSFLWTWGRALRFIDGPDEVHLRTVARSELRKHRGSRSATAAFVRPME